MRVEDRRVDVGRMEVKVEMVHLKVKVEMAVVKAIFFCAIAATFLWLFFLVFRRCPRWQLIPAFH